MEYQDIIPEGLIGKTEAEREEIIEHWEELHDLKQAIIEGEIPEARDQLPEIEQELAEVSKKLEPREAVPETGVLIKDAREFILCPRCGTFVQFAPERVKQVSLEFKETPEEARPADKYIIRSITCPVCKWGLGVPEMQ